MPGLRTILIQRCPIQGSFAPCRKRSSDKGGEAHDGKSTKCRADVSSKRLPQGIGRSLRRKHTSWLWRWRPGHCGKPKKYLWRPDRCHRRGYNRTGSNADNQVCCQPCEEPAMNENKIPRRQFLKLGGAALAMIPVIVASGRARLQKPWAVARSFPMTPKYHLKATAWPGPRKPSLRQYLSAAKDSRRFRVPSGRDRA